MSDQLTKKYKLPRWRLEIFVALFSAGRMVIYLNHLDFLDFWWKLGCKLKLGN